MSAASDGAKIDSCYSVPKWIIAYIARLNTLLDLSEYAKYKGIEIRKVFE